MKLTSQEAGKLVKKMNEKLQAILAMEKKSASFLASGTSCRTRQSGVEICIFILQIKMETTAFFNL